MSSILRKASRIFVAGHAGLVGSAIVRCLRRQGFRNVITAPRSKLDLRSQRSVADYLDGNRFDCVIIAAARVGGINANDTFPAEFIYDNLAIQSNLIHYAHKTKVGRLLFLGSSCIYPKYCRQPMRECDLLTGELEPTNEPYAIAKIAGIKLCESYNRQFGTDFRSAMPTNLYGPGDNFDLDASHVIPALLRKFHEAKLSGASKVDVWGTGAARREFLYVDDLAEACVFLLSLNHARYWSHVSERCSHVNVGTGVEVSIAELATMIRGVVGYRGAIKYQTEKPDGTQQKLLDVSRLNGLGWAASTSLEIGLKDTYGWFCDNQELARLGP